MKKQFLVEIDAMDEEACEGFVKEIQKFKPISMIPFFPSIANIVKKMENPERKCKPRKPTNRKVYKPSKLLEYIYENYNSKLDGTFLKDQNIIDIGLSVSSATNLMYKFIREGILSRRITEYGYVYKISDEFAKKIESRIVNKPSKVA